MSIELEAFKAIILYFSTTPGGIAYLVFSLIVWILWRALNREITGRRKDKDESAQKMIAVYKEIDAQQNQIFNHAKETSLFLEGRLRNAITLNDEEELKRKNNNA